MLICYLHIANGDRGRSAAPRWAFTIAPAGAPERDSGRVVTILNTPPDRLSGLSKVEIYESQQCSQSTGLRFLSGPGF